MMTAEEALCYINNYTWSKSRLGLDRTRQLLGALGNPHKKLKFVHVAGSNGKGSTCAMIESVLRCAGYKAGLYPSPYIEDFKESFQVCGDYISNEELCFLTEKVSRVADEMSDHPSQFELKTAIAMLFFALRKCDIVVLEVGMGGELDSTNVIDSPEVAVITNIGLEHTEYLGNTLSEIAIAKAGIIKPGCDVVCYDNPAEVMDVIKRRCDKMGCDLYKTAADDAKEIRHSLDAQMFKWNELILSMPLLGLHQLKNAAVALKTLGVLRGRGYIISDSDIAKGFSTVRWPARFEVLSKEPLFILDGGHNPQCAIELAGNLDEYLTGEKLTFLIGVLADKDYNAIVNIIAPYASEFICVTPDSERALSGKELAQVVSEKGGRSVYMESIKEAVSECMKSGRKTVAFGSLYMAGEVRRVWRILNYHVLNLQRN